MKSTNRTSLLLWISVALLLFIMAAPALGDVIANSVGSAEIIDGSIKSRDIGRGAVSARNIAKGAVKPAKIAGGAVRSSKIADGAVNSAKIADGTITNADIAAGAAIAASKINRTGLNADLLDGQNGSDFVGKTGNHAMAGKLTAADFAYGTPQTRHLAIHASALRPELPTYVYNQFGYYLYATGPATEVYFSAPVYLPDGATVTNVTYQAWDNTSYDSRASLVRWRGAWPTPGTATADQMAGIWSAGESAAWREFSSNVIYEPEIDNVNYAYFVEVRLHGSAGNNLRAGKITVTYQTSQP
jgi:hypothetical protein